MPIPVREYVSGAEVLAAARRRVATPVVSRALVRPNEAGIVQREPSNPFAMPDDVRVYGPPAPAHLSAFEEHIARCNGALTTLTFLVRLVPEVTGVHAADLRSERRNAPIVKARQILYWLARRYTQHSLPRIGEKAGGRDHTSVLHGIRRVDAVIAMLGLAPESGDDARAWAHALWSASWPCAPGARIA